MIKAEKYLKEGIKYHDLACEIAVFVSNSYKKGLVQNIDDFFKQKIKPILSSEEKIILKNIKEYNFIGRDDTNDLYLVFKFSTYTKKFYFNMYRHLFLFIKERRGI